MAKHVLIINGHPDPRPERFCTALCDAYAEGVQSKGGKAQRIDVARLALPSISDVPRNWEPRELAAAIDCLHRAERLAIIFPLWLDAPPSGLRNFLSLAARVSKGAEERTAQCVVTMGMPAFIYRGLFQPGDTSLPRPDALSLPGITPAKHTFIGSVDTLSAQQRTDWLHEMRAEGAQNAWLPFLQRKPAAQPRVEPAWAPPATPAFC